MSVREIVARWLDAAMPHRQGPQIGRVLKFNSGSGENTYSARVRVLRPGSLEETERILEDVPYSPIWAGPDGTGVYAPLPVDTLVIVGYVEFNPAHPYIEGVWGEFYQAADFKPKEFLITNGTTTITVKPNELRLNGDSLGGLVKVNQLITHLRMNEEFLRAIQTAIKTAVNPNSLLANLKTSEALDLGDFSSASNFENSKVKHGG